MTKPNHLDEPICVYCGIHPKLNGGTCRWECGGCRLVSVFQEKAYPGILGDVAVERVSREWQKETER